MQQQESLFSLPVMNRDHLHCALGTFTKPLYYTQIPNKCNKNIVIYAFIINNKVYILLVCLRTENSI